MFKVDYPEFGFKSAKREYEAGEAVEVIFYIVATDTSYTFEVNVEDLKRTYENGCIVLRFTMPEHDVTIKCGERSVMTPGPVGFMGLGLMTMEEVARLKAEAERKNEIKNTPEDKFCRICGEKRINSAKFCTGCGAGFEV